MSCYEVLVSPSNCYELREMEKIPRYQPPAKRMPVKTDFVTWTVYEDERRRHCNTQVALDRAMAQLEKVTSQLARLQTGDKPEPARFFYTPKSKRYHCERAGIPCSIGGLPEYFIYCSYEMAVKVKGRGCQSCGPELAYLSNKVHESS